MTQFQTYNRLLFIQEVNNNNVQVREVSSHLTAYSIYDEWFLVFSWPFYSVGSNICYLNPRIIKMNSLVCFV